MVFDRANNIQRLDKRGDPGTQAMVQAGAKQSPNGRQRVNPIYKAEGQEPDNKATQKD